MTSSPGIRWMDRYLGSAICFFLSLAGKILPAQKPIKPGEVKNILLIELFEMGASVMTCPAVLYLLEKNPGVRIHVLTTESIRSSWLKIPEIAPGCVYGLEEKSLFAFLFSFWETRARLNSIPIDLVIDFELFFRITAIFSFFIRARRKGGFLRYRLEGLYRGSIYDTGCQFNQNTHIARNFLALAKTVLKGTRHVPEHKGVIDAAELKMGCVQSQGGIRSSLEKKLPFFPSQPYLLVAPDVGSNLRVRNYPLDRLQTALNDIMGEFPTHYLGLIGTQENHSSCEKLRQMIGEARVFNLAGQTTIDELFELLLSAKLLISNDNGPIHFAALTQTPTLALFSTDSPYVYGPLGNCLILYSHFQCSPCIMAYNHKQSDCRDNLCLQAIPAKEVSQWARRMLREDAEIRYRTINNKIPYLA